MTYETSDFVRAALEGDAVNAQEVFNHLARNHIATAIDAERQAVAANYFQGAVADEHPEQ